jgi:glycosyltransferase involved in cell wall biosynthesis
MYPTAELFARELPASLRVAYAADDYSEMPGVNSEFIRSMEREWIDGSDIVFCSATNLVDRYRAWGHDDVHLLAHGVDIEAFLNAVPGGLPGLEHLDGPIIGFVGAISPWVDLELIGVVADHFPEATVVLVGPIDTDLGRLAERKNVLVAGPVPFEKVPRIMKRFDVGIIPFAQTPLMDSVNPLKLLEYLAAGVPVVSTPMGDMEEVEGAVGVGSDSESFIRNVEQALASTRTPALVDQRIAIAQKRSWQSVAMEFLSTVERRSGRIA